MMAFLSLPKESDWRPIKVHVDNKGTIDGLWRGERKCTDPKAGDADLWTKNLGRVAAVNVGRHTGGSRAS